MPPSESLRSRNLDDVDEYIRSRRERGAGRRERQRPPADGREPRRGRRDSAERARARELLETDFSWSDGTHRADLPELVSPYAAPAPVADPAPYEADGPPAPAAPPGRRTVVITGHGSERYLAPRRGYDSRLRPHERSGFRPDRVALWAVLLGLALVLGAATSSHAAVLHAVALHLTALHAPALHVR